MENLVNSALISYNPKLRELLDSGWFDWDNPLHREAFLKTWVKQPFQQEEDFVDHSDR